jgi:plastocyanin
MRGTAFRGGLVLTAATAILIAPWAGPAWAGGGCHKPLTEGRGDTVEMKEACFGPSILSVDPGTEVTFVNRDAVVHNVGANGWGEYDDMHPGDAFTATFRESGIYPFACSYHPGMTGAVVVGDGAGAGSGASVMGPSTLTEAKAETAEGTGADVAPSSADPSAAPVGWVAGGIVGLAVGASLGMIWRGRGRKDPASA